MGDLGSEFTVLIMESGSNTVHVPSKTSLLLYFLRHEIVPETNKFTRCTDFRKIKLLQLFKKLKLSIITVF